MSWLFGSDNNSQAQPTENQHNTRSSQQPLLPPLGSDRPPSPFPSLRVPGVGRARSPRPPSTPQVVGHQFFFPPTDSLSTNSAQGAVSKVEGDSETEDIVGIFEDFEETEANMAMSADAQAVLAAA